jgi:hypothetical protein
MRYGDGMTKTKQITKAQVKSVIKGIIADFPDRANPTDQYDNCVYHNGGRGASVRRCIIGEMGHRMALPKPAPDAGSVRLEVAAPGGVWDELFTDSAVKYMGMIQLSADSYEVGEVSPLRWGEIPKSVVNS